jgi:CRISPR-associated protein Cst2
MVHIVTPDGSHASVNAVSGDMFKHIFVEHLTPLLEEAGEPLSDGARLLNSDRINIDKDFIQTVKGNKSGIEVQDEILKRCAVTDIAGTLVTEGGKSVARKSCAEFGWVVGIPDMTHTEQYFHVKYAPETREKSAGHGDTVAGKQAIFHRPANSGVYAFICQLELNRIGRNDLTREHAVSEESRRKRMRAAIQALMSTLIRPAGAQRNTQHPHILGCEGIVSTSSSYLPAPNLSPLTAGFVEQIAELANVLNQVHAGALETHRFSNLAEAAETLRKIAKAF